MSTNLGQGTDGGRSGRGPRNFNEETEGKCWAKADPIPGRDPDRWRFDAAGNPVLKDFRGWQGLVGWELDHIDPYWCGGESILDNCQVLQTKLNRRKGGREGVTLEQLQEMSSDVKVTEPYMDAFEMGLYGNITGERGEIKCTCLSKAEAEGGGLKAGRKAISGCKDPFTCPKNDGCCDLLAKLLVAMRCRNSSPCLGSRLTLPAEPKQLPADFIN